MLKNFLHKDLIEAGCDEAGRGCLAGPVFAAAVIWPRDLNIDGIDDSKKLNKRQRDQLRDQIENSGIIYTVAKVSHTKIDEINILNASFLAMHRALDQLKLKPEHLLIDGNRFRPYHNTGHTCVIKGDGKYISIAAASILAKTYRDEYMQKIDLEYPEYGWKTNMGYATVQHRQAILKYGITPYHRKVFCRNVLNQQKSLFE